MSFVVSVRSRVARACWSRALRRAGGLITLGACSQIRSFAVLPASRCSLRIGANSIFAGRLSFDREGASVIIGDRTYIGASHIVAAQRIEIGDDVLISWGCTLVDHHSHSLNFDERAADVTNWLVGKKDWTHVSSSPVQIDDKVWIGFNAAILPGVTIGEGAIIGACSVVTKDVEPWTVVAGNPARVIRRVCPGGASSPRQRLDDELT